MVGVFETVLNKPGTAPCSLENCHHSFKKMHGNDVTVFVNSQLHLALTRQLDSNILCSPVVSHFKKIYLINQTLLSNRRFFRDIFLDLGGLAPKSGQVSCCAERPDRCGRWS
jgi:hypothetical protein